MKGILLTELNGELKIEIQGYDKWETIRLIRQAYYENVEKWEVVDEITKLKNENRNLNDLIKFISREAGFRNIDNIIRLIKEYNEFKEVSDKEIDKALSNLQPKDQANETK